MIKASLRDFSRRRTGWESRKERITKETCISCRTR